MKSFSAPESGRFCDTVYCQLVLSDSDFLFILCVWLTILALPGFFLGKSWCLCPNAVFLEYLHLHPVWWFQLFIGEQCPAEPWAEELPALERAILSSGAIPSQEWFKTLELREVPAQGSAQGSDGVTIPGKNLWMCHLRTWLNDEHDGGTGLEAGLDL